MIFPIFRAESRTTGKQVASQAGDSELLVVVRRLRNNGQGVEWDSPAFATGAGDFVGAGVFAGGGVVSNPLAR